MPNGELQTVINFGKPENNQVRAAPYQLVLSAVPYTVDFRALSGSDLSGTPFKPSGVYIDNTQGTANCVVLVNELGYRMICKKGEVINLPYPAAKYSTVSITGEGMTTIIFVDYPVDPYESQLSGGSGVAIWGGIIGNILDQTDLQDEFALKADTSYVDMALGFKANTTYVDSGLALKVDKVAGKQLSSEDYTSSEKTKLAGIQAGAQVNAVTSVATKTGAVTLVKGDVGLGNADNTSDANKPVSGPQQTALDLKLDVTSPSILNDATVTRYSNTAGTSSNVTLQRFRGTQGSPLPVLNNDRIGGFAFQSRASDGTDYANVVMEAYSREDQTATGKGALFQFSTVKVGATTRSAALVIDNAGQISISNGFYAGAPSRLAPYTLTTLPSAAASTNFLIIVTNATGGAKVCYSNGTNWLILNTTTVVS